MKRLAIGVTVVLAILTALPRASLAQEATALPDAVLGVVEAPNLNRLDRNLRAFVTAAVPEAAPKMPPIVALLIHATLSANP